MIKTSIPLIIFMYVHRAMVSHGGQPIKNGKKN